MSETENETTEETTPEATPEATAEATPEATAEPTPVEAEADSTPVEETDAAEAVAPPAEDEAVAPPAEDEAVAPPAPPAVSGPKPKRKRLARALRPQKGGRSRTPATERKPISRQPKPEHERGRTQERRGVVVSDAMDKTIVVKVDMIKSHPRYKKVIRRTVKFHAHDEQNTAHIGDVVRIVETRPLSKTKRWRLAEVIEVAK
jgi:ribosomal protein uS17